MAKSLNGDVTFLAFDAVGGGTDAPVTNGTDIAQAPATGRERCDVTVVIPVFNRASLLRRTLASVAAQTMTPLEVLVVDDGSAVGEAAKIRSIVSEFEQLLDVRLLVNELNRGLPETRNRGIAEARGEYVAFLDSDDLWLPEKLERQMRAIRSAGDDGKPVLSATGIYRIDDAGRILQRKPCKSRFDADAVSKSIFAHPCSLVVERTVARAIGGFASDVGLAEDWDFCIRLAGRARFAGVPDPLTLHVDHNGDRLTNNRSKMLRALLLLRRKHMRDRPLAKDGLYRKVARELQAVGKLRTARRFYIASCALQYREGWRRRLVEGLLQLYLPAGTPFLWTKQRSSWPRIAAKRRRDPKIRSKWDRDQEAIWILMRADGAAR
ncbi:MAG: glycosyltransferase family 2 protein [Parvibaculaceae bacterium]